MKKMFLQNFNLNTPENKIAEVQGEATTAEPQEEANLVNRVNTAEKASKVSNKVDKASINLNNNRRERLQNKHIHFKI